MVLADVEDTVPALRVLAIGDHERIRDALDALERGSGVALARAASADTSEEADVAIVVAEHGRAARTTRSARSTNPGVKVVVVLEDDDARVIADVMAAGASGVLAGSPDGSELARATRRAAAGEIVLPAHHVAALVSTVDAGRGRGTSNSVLDRLTAREREILRSLAQGRSAAEIGGELGISTLTVQTHLKSILAKLGAHSKIEAITLAWREGLAPMPSSA